MTGDATVRGAEALRNGDGEIALFVPALGGRPLGWRETAGGVVAVEVSGGRLRRFGCPPDALMVARERGRLLLVEVDGAAGPSGEWWLRDLTDIDGA